MYASSKMHDCFVGLLNTLVDFHRAGLERQLHTPHLRHSILKANKSIKLGSYSLEDN